MTPEALADRLGAVCGGDVRVRRWEYGARVTWARAGGQEIDVAWTAGGGGPWVTIEGELDAHLAAALAVAAELLRCRVDREAGAPGWFGAAEIAAVRAMDAPQPCRIVDIAVARQRRLG